MGRCPQTPAIESYNMLITRRFLLFFAGLFWVFCWQALVWAGESLQLVDMQERELDGAPAIMAMFSQPLDANILYEQYITVEENQRQIPYSWVVGKNPRQLFLPHVKPETKYRVSFSRGLPAKNAGGLTEEAVRKLTVRKLQPAFGFASSQPVLPARIAAGLPVMTVNVPEVDIQFLRVENHKLPKFINQQFLARQTTAYNWTLQEYSKYTKSVFSGRFATPGADNTRTVTHIAVADIKALQQPGLYLALMTRPNYFGNTKVSQFTITDIGLHARLFPTHMEIFTRSLETGAAIANVELRLRNSKNQPAIKIFSDKNGRARIAVVPSRKAILTASFDQHFSFLSFSEPALDLSAFAIAGAISRPVSLFPYTPRDLYRPGENIQLSLLARDHDGGPITPRPIAVKLLRPDGKMASNFTMLVEPGNPQLGYYQQNIPLPAAAPTGRWLLEFRTDPGAKKADTTLNIQVEEFLPERMKLALATPTELLAPEDNFPLTIQGDYLYGAPAAGNRLQRIIHRRFEPHPVKKLPKFFFGNSDEKNLSKRQPLTEVKLDREGKFVFDVPLTSHKPSSPITYKLVASLFESGGRPVSRSISRTYWPDKTLIGVRPLFQGEVAESNQPLAIEIVNSRPDATLLAAKNLDVRIIHEERQHHWVYDGDSWRVDSIDNHYPVLQTNLDIAAGAVGRIEVPITYGAYRIEVIEPISGLKTLHRFHAGWRWQEREQAAGVRPARVGLLFDKDGYEVGDIAKLTIKPPHPGEALILVESDRILWQKRIKIVSGEFQVTIPIDPAWNSHDIYTTVLLFRPTTTDATITPTRAIGITHLPLARQKRRLQIKLAAPQ